MEIELSRLLVRGMCNSLPSKIRNIFSLDAFKKHLKTFLSARYKNAPVKLVAKTNANVNSGKRVVILEEETRKPL